MGTSFNNTGLESSCRLLRHVFALNEDVEGNRNKPLRFFIDPIESLSLLYNRFYKYSIVIILNHKYLAVNIKML